MAKIKFTNIDLSDIPRAIQGATFVSSDLGVSAIKSNIAFKNVALYEQSQADSSDAKSYLGTPVFDTITLGNLSNKSQNSYIDILGEQKTFEPIRIYNAILEVTQTKNIINTPIQGRNGTIKQYISDGDFLITLNGRVSGVYDNVTGQWSYDSKKFPQQGVKSIIDICKVNANISVSSFFLYELFGITDVVITDYSFFQREGNRNEQLFTINMLSDSDAILEFTEEQVNESEFLNTILNV